MFHKIGDSVYCICCDVKFQRKADFDSHCNGKKHKANERVRGEQKAAKCSVLIRGARGCKNLEEFLATYFCHFGLLAKISALGPVKNGVIRVQYMEEESVRRVLSLGPTHEHDGIKFQVSKFIYKPQMGDAMRLSQKEETSKQKVARTNLHANICELLGKTKSVEEGLQSVTENFQLSPQDFKDRAGIVRKLAEVFASHNPGCCVYQFGSSINGFGMRGCDLDLFLNLDLPHTISKKQLKELAKVLSSGSLSGSFKDILPIPSQRCPIIKFTHKPTGIKCDLSMDNKKALLNSRLLQLYSSDLRVKQVVFALRLWAKFRRLSKSEETWTQSLLSSYALTLLALFFLMVCKPCPVIPAVCDLEKFIPGIMVETVEECDCLVIPKGAQLPPSKNTQSTVELLQGLFKFYSQEIDFNHDALLLWDAKTVPRASLAQNSSYVNCRIGTMTVIDPFNLSHNVVGNVNANFCPRLVAEMKRAAELSAHWESKSSSDHQVEAHRGLTGLFELADLEADKKASKSGKKKQKTSKKTPEKGEKETKPFVGRMEGEQENGEFHIILSMSKATLKSKELLEAAREQGLTPEQHWLHLAKDYTIKVLEEVFLAQLVENRGESSKGETLMEVDSKEKPAEAQPKGKKRVSHNAFTVEGTSENVSSMGSEKVTRGLDLEEMPQKRLCFDAGTTILPCPLSNTSTISATTSLCSITRVPSTSLTCDSTAVTNSTLMTSSSSSASSTINSSTHRTVTTTPAPQISLQCTCCHQVWQGRKKLRTKMIQEIDPSLSSVTSLAFERELTQRLLGCQADGDVSQRFPTETINVEQTLKDLFGQPHCQKDMCAFDGKATDASSVEHENYCMHEMRIGENGTGLIASDNCKNINATAERDKFIAPAEYSGTTCINAKGIHVSPESHILACKNGNGALAIQEDKWNSTNSSVSGVIRSVENPATVGMSSKTDVRPVDSIAKSKSGNNSSGTTEVNASVGKNVTNEEGVSATTDIDAESSGDNTFLSQSSNDDDMTTTNGSDSSVSKNSNDGAAGLGSCSIKCESGNVVSASSVSHTTTGKGESCVETVPKTTMFGNKDKKEVTVSDGKTDHKTSNSQCQAHLEKPTAESSEGTSCSSKKQSAFCVEFSCDLVMSGGGSAHNDEEAGRDPSSHPHLLIKLRPSQSCLSQFKVFYDPFRSVMQKLSMFELNVIAQKVPT